MALQKQNPGRGPSTTSTTPMTPSQHQQQPVQTTTPKNPSRQPLITPEALGLDVRSLLKSQIESIDESVEKVKLRNRSLGEKLVTLTRREDFMENGTSTFESPRSHRHGPSAREELRKKNKKLLLLMANEFFFLHDTIKEIHFKQNANNNIVKSHIERAKAAAAAVITSQSQASGSVTNDRNVQHEESQLAVDAQNPNSDANDQNLNLEESQVTVDSQILSGFNDQNTDSFGESSAVDQAKDDGEPKQSSVDSQTNQMERDEEEGYETNGHIHEPKPKETEQDNQSICDNFKTQGQGSNQTNEDCSSSEQTQELLFGEAEASEGVIGALANGVDEDLFDNTPSNEVLPTVNEDDDDDEDELEEEVGVIIFVPNPIDNLDVGNRQVVVNPSLFSGTSTWVGNDTNWASTSTRNRNIQQIKQEQRHKQEQPKDQSEEADGDDDIQILEVIQPRNQIILVANKVYDRIEEKYTHYSDLQIKNVASDVMSFIDKLNNLCKDGKKKVTAKRENNTSVIFAQMKQLENEILGILGDDFDLRALMHINNPESGIVFEIFKSLNLSDEEADALK